MITKEDIEKLKKYGFEDQGIPGHPLVYNSKLLQIDNEDMEPFFSISADRNVPEYCFHPGGGDIIYFNSDIGADGFISIIGNISCVDTEY